MVYGLSRTCQHQTKLRHDRNKLMAQRIKRREDMRIFKIYSDLIITFRLFFSMDVPVPIRAKGILIPPSTAQLNFLYQIHLFSILKTSSACCHGVFALSKSNEDITNVCSSCSHKSTTIRQTETSHLAGIHEQPLLLTSLAPTCITQSLFYSKIIPHRSNGAKCSTRYKITTYLPSFNFFSITSSLLYFTSKNLSTCFP
jgi:hypothetical protein